MAFVHPCKKFRAKSSMIPWALPSGLCVCVCVCARAHTRVHAQSCPTLCDPMDCNPPGFSVKFSRWEYWSGLPFPNVGDLPNPRIEPVSLVSPVLAGGFFTTAPLGKFLPQGCLMVFSDSAFLSTYWASRRRKRREIALTIEHIPLYCFHMDTSIQKEGWECGLLLVVSLSLVTVVFCKLR